MHNFVESAELRCPVADQFGVRSAHMELLTGEFQEFAIPGRLNGIRPQFVNVLAACSRGLRCGNGPQA